VQVINAGFDVVQGQFDLFVGGGGFGYFTALNTDSSVHYCEGGPCRQGMYDGSFADWTYSPYPAPNPCYNGGVRLLNETSASQVWARCRALSGNSKQLKDKILLDTCFRANKELYHQNFVSSNYMRVICPNGLIQYIIMLTGMRRDDEEGLPDIDITNELKEECRGSRENGRYALTSMADGCVASCAWPGKVGVDPKYKRVDRCARSGMPLR